MTQIRYILHNPILELSNNILLIKTPSGTAYDGCSNQVCYET